MGPWSSTIPMPSSLAMVPVMGVRHGTFCLHLFHLPSTPAPDTGHLLMSGFFFFFFPFKHLVEFVHGRDSFQEGREKMSLSRPFSHGQRCCSPLKKRPDCPAFLPSAQRTGSGDSPTSVLRRNSERQSLTLLSDSFSLS